MTHVRGPLLVATVSTQPELPPVLDQPPYAAMGTVPESATRDRRIGDQAHQSRGPCPRSPTVPATRIEAGTVPHGTGQDLQRDREGTGPGTAMAVPAGEAAGTAAGSSIAEKPLLRAL